MVKYPPHRTKNKLFLSELQKFFFVKNIQFLYKKGYTLKYVFGRFEDVLCYDVFCGISFASFHPKSFYFPDSIADIGSLHVWDSFSLVAKNGTLREFIRFNGHGVRTFFHHIEVPRVESI